MTDAARRSTGAAELRRWIRTGLEARADPRRASAMKTYMKSTMPFYGVAAPQVHRFVRELAGGLRFEHATPWRSTMRQVWDRAEFREERYVVIGLCRSRIVDPFQTPATLPLYAHMVSTGAWWDLVDEIATHLVGRILRVYPSPTAERLRAWSRSNDLWRRRTAILAQIGSRDRTDHQLLEDCITPSLGSREFFLRKAIGWALRSEAYADPRWVAAYVADHENDLSPLSRREALKHIDARGAPRAS